MNTQHVVQGASGTLSFSKKPSGGDTGVPEGKPIPVLQYPNQDARLAGLVDDVDPAEHLPGRLLPQTDVSTRLALIAAEEALGDAGADTSAMADYDMGIVTASASGGFEFTHREFRKLWSRGPEHVSVYESFAWFYAVNTGQISIRHGMRGPSTWCSPTRRACRSWTVPRRGRCARSSASARSRSRRPRR